MSLGVPLKGTTSKGWFLVIIPVLIPLLWVDEILHSIHSIAPITSHLQIKTNEQADELPQLDPLQKR